MKRLLLLVLLIALLANCEENESVEPLDMGEDEQSSHALFGSWDIVESEISYCQSETDICESSSEGIYKKMTFTMDSAIFYYSNNSYDREYFGFELIDSTSFRLHNQSTESGNWNGLHTVIWKNEREAEIENVFYSQDSSAYFIDDYSVQKLDD